MKEKLLVGNFKFLECKTFTFITLNPSGRTRLISKQMSKRKHAKDCSALVSKRNQPKKYEVSKHFFYKKQVFINWFI